VTRHESARACQDMDMRKVKVAENYVEQGYTKYFLKKNSKTAIQIHKVNY